MKPSAGNPTGALRVLIAGRAALANAALADLLKECEDTVVLGGPTKRIAALALADRMKPDVVLLDLEWAGGMVFQTIYLLREIVPPPAVIVLAQQVTVVVRRLCQEAGADLVFEKTADLDKLIEALRTLHRRKAAEARLSRKSG